MIKCPRSRTIVVGSVIRVKNPSYYKWKEGFP
nr:MAG TPA: hypothetical protein [Caudoviricetes sp.]